MENSRDVGIFTLRKDEKKIYFPWSLNVIPNLFLDDIKQTKEGDTEISSVWQKQFLL